MKKYNIYTIYSYTIINLNNYSKYDKKTENSQVNLNKFLHIL